MIPATTIVLHNNIPIYVKKRNTIMSNKESQFAHAIKTVRTSVNDLTTKIANAQPGAERDALEAQLKQLMEDVGMEYTTNPKLKQAEATVTKTETTVEEVVTERKSVTIVKPSLWQRVKTSYAMNKKKFWAGFAVILGAAAGTVYYFVKVKGGTAAPALARMAEAGIEAPADVPAGEGEAAASVFTRIGAWFVSAGASIKNGFVAAINWVKNLFTKTAKESANAEVPAEAVPA